MLILGLFFSRSDDLTTLKDFRCVDLTSVRDELSRHQKFERSMNGNFSLLSHITESSFETKRGPKKLGFRDPLGLKSILKTIRMPPSVHTIATDRVIQKGARKVYRNR